MDFFSEALARLKHTLRVSKDQEVAEALGLSKTAFSERKKRGAFPEENLRALAAKRPELGIDVNYVLDGDQGDEPATETKDEFSKRLQGINSHIALLASMPLSDKSRTRLSLLLTGDPEQDGRLIAKALQEQAAPTDLAPAPASNDYVYVPRYDVAASAGGGALVHDEAVVDHLAFKRDWVTRALGLDPQRLALIDVAGDSMSPTIESGDLILVDTRPLELRNEGVFVINVAGMLLVKRLKIRLSGMVEVVSDNPRYGTETISGDQLGQLQIVGRVVWKGSRM